MQAHRIGGEGSGIKIVGLFLIPLVFALVQLWASRSIIGAAGPGPLTDGIHYIEQARDFQALLQHPDIWSAKLARFVLELSLYPVFLAAFDLSQVADWSTASAHPQVLVVASAQAAILSISTGLFLLLAFRLVAGHPLKRIAISMLLGCMLLSPLVVMWPRFVQTEAVTLSALLAFAGACLAHDSKRKYALVLVGLASCLLVLFRNPMIFFVWVFVGLVGLNILFARWAWTRPLAAGVLALMLAAGLGGARASYLSAGGVYIQTLVQIIQFRMLPDPERRAFFAARGMPTTAVVMERSGKPAWYNNSLFMPDDEVAPDFVAYRNWIVADGNRTYAAFLLSHPGYLLHSLVRSPTLDSVDYNPDFHFTIGDLFSTPMYGNEVELAPYPSWLGRFLLAPVGWLLPLLFFAAAALRYVGRTIRGRLASAMEIGAIAAGVGIFVSYHTDAWDLWRHSIPFMLLIYLSMIVCTAEMAKDTVRFAQRRFAFGATKGLPA